MSHKHTQKIVGHIKVPMAKTYSPKWAAHYAKKAMEELTPIARAKAFSPSEALVMMAFMMDQHITQKQRSLDVDEIQTLCDTILGIWETGILIPNTDYPYTLQETLASFENGGSDEEAN